MKNRYSYFISFLLILFINPLFSQIEFEKGYYIDESDNRKVCFIKNVDWRNNPTEIEYIISAGEEPATMTIKSIKEFGIDGYSKYVRKTIDIDRSTEEIDRMSISRNPTFNKETIFLKVLLEGKANLYEYIDGLVKRYFYSNDNSNVEQLVYKKYRTPDGNVKENTRYIQQLWNNLKCSTIEQKNIERLDYRKNDLVDFFEDYNMCSNSEFKNFKKLESRKNVQINIRPGLKYAQLSSKIISQNTIKEFPSKTSFRLGVEVEFFLPFNKNTWSVIVEPTLQYYTLDQKVNYRSLEIPFGGRHYFYLNGKNAVFLNAQICLNINGNSTVALSPDSSTIVDVSSSPNYVFGLGYMANDKMKVELRHQTNRDILSAYSLIDSIYKSYELIFSYQIL